MIADEVEPSNWEFEVVVDRSQLAGLDVHLRIFDFWQELAKESYPPAREVFDPIDLRGDLKNVFLAERIIEDGRRRYRMRVHGTAVVAILGRDVSRRSLDEVLPPERVRPLVRGFDRAIERGAGVLESFNSLFPGREHIRVVRLVLPLRGHRPDEAFVLGCLVRQPE